MRNVRDKSWYVYILRCRDSSLYTGIARDPIRRLDTHSRGQGSAYVRSRLPVRLIYTERCRGRGAALRREAELKRWTRAEKLALVSKPGKSD